MNGYPCVPIKLYLPKKKKQKKPTKKEMHISCKKYYLGNLKKLRPKMVTIIQYPQLAIKIGEVTHSVISSSAFFNSAGGWTYSLSLITSLPYSSCVLALSKNQANESIITLHGTFCVQINCYFLK